MLRIVAVMVRSKARQNKIGVDPRSDKGKGDQRNFGMVFFVLKEEEQFILKNTGN